MRIPTAIELIAKLDAQSRPAVLEICSSRYANVLLRLPLQKPSFRETAGGMVMNGTPISGIIRFTGTAAVARLMDGRGNVWVNNLSVGITDADVIASTTSFIAGSAFILPKATISMV